MYRHFVVSERLALRYIVSKGWQHLESGNYTCTMHHKWHGGMFSILEAFHIELELDSSDV